LASNHGRSLWCSSSARNANVSGPKPTAAGFAAFVTGFAAFVAGFAAFVAGFAAFVAGFAAGFAASLRADVFAIAGETIATRRPVRLDIAEPRDTIDIVEQPTPRPRG
jgi:hypothetical protein